MCVGRVTAGMMTSVGQFTEMKYVCKLINYCFAFLKFNQISITLFYFYTLGEKYMFFLHTSNTCFAIS